MTRCTVTLWTRQGKRTVRMTASVLATDDALIDLARKRAGIAGRDLQHGSVES